MVLDKNRVIFPIPYGSVTTFDETVWYLDKDVSLQTIYDEDFGAFLNYSDDEYYKLIVNKNTKCFYIYDSKYDNFKSFVREYSIILKFVMNNFCDSSPIIFPFAASLSLSNDTQTNEVTIEDISDIETSINFHRLKNVSFKLKPRTEIETLSKFYQVVNKSIKTNPTVYFLLERFNSCLSRDEIFDKIVDITISLESLISGTQELRYRFALNNSLICVQDNTERIKAFELFAALYDARSAIVHGDISSRDKKKALKKVKDNWTRIMRLARASINYFIFFLYKNERSKWDNHIKNLVFGNDERIVD